MSADRTVTVKEAEVVRLIARGLCSKEIAGSLGIDEETVKDRVGRAMHRVGAASRAQLVALYLTPKRGPRQAPAPSLELWERGAA